MADKRRLAVLLMLTTAVGVTGAIILSARAPAPREIHLVGRNTTFYLEGSADPNPILHMRAGESIRIVFRNTDAGMRHDFTIPGWDVESNVVAGPGETSVTFKVPERGRAEYNCTPHATVMKGTIVVE